MPRLQQQQQTKTQTLAVDTDDDDDDDSNSNLVNDNVYCAVIVAQPLCEFTRFI